MKPSVWARPMPATVDGQVKSKTPKRGQRHQESPPQQPVTNLASQLQASHYPLESQLEALTTLAIVLIYKLVEKSFHIVELHYRAQ